MLPYAINHVSVVSGLPPPGFPIISTCSRRWGLHDGGMLARHRKRNCANVGGSMGQLLVPYHVACGGDVRRCVLRMHGRSARFSLLPSTSDLSEIRRAV